MMSQHQNTDLIEIYQVYWNSNDFDSFKSGHEFVLVKFPFHYRYLQFRLKTDFRRSASAILIRNI